MVSPRAKIAIVPALALACVAVISLSAARVSPNTSEAGQPDFPQSTVMRGLAHWDSTWYANVARDGYWYRPGEQSPVAFFPGYPLAIRAVMGLGVNRWLGAAGLTFLCGIFGVLLFSRWAGTVTDPH